MILTALLFSTETMWYATWHGALCHSQVSVDTAFCDHPSHKMSKSISEMNAASQFALGRSSVHSEGCHHIRHWVSWEQNMQVSCLVRAQLEVSNTSPCEWSLYFALVLSKWTEGLLQTAHVTPIDMLTTHNQTNQLWLEQSGHFTRGLKCIQLFFSRHRQGHACRGLLKTSLFDWELKQFLT